MYLTVSLHQENIPIKELNYYHPHVFLIYLMVVSGKQFPTLRCLFNVSCIILHHFFFSHHLNFHKKNKYSCYWYANIEFLAFVFGLHIILCFLMLWNLLACILYAVFGYIWYASQLSLDEYIQLTAQMSYHALALSFICWKLFFVCDIIGLLKHICLLNSLFILTFRQARVLSVANSLIKSPESLW